MWIPELGLYVPMGLYLRNPRNYLLDTSVPRTEDDILNQTQPLSFIHDDQFDILVEKMKWPSPFANNDSQTNLHHHHRRLTRRKRNTPLNISYRKKPVL
jgi:hypothetical protein